MATRIGATHRSQRPCRRLKADLMFGHSSANVTNSVSKRSWPGMSILNGPLGRRPLFRGIPTAAQRFEFFWTAIACTVNRIDFSCIFLFTKWSMRTLCWPKRKTNMMHMVQISKKWWLTSIKNINWPWQNIHVSRASQSNTKTGRYIGKPKDLQICRQSPKWRQPHEKTTLRGVCTLNDCVPLSCDALL